DPPVSQQIVDRAAPKAEQPIHVPDASKLRPLASAVARLNRGDGFCFSFHSGQGRSRPSIASPLTWACLLGESHQTAQRLFYALQSNIPLAPLILILLSNLFKCLHIAETSCDVVWFALALPVMKYAKLDRFTPTRKILCGHV